VRCYGRFAIGDRYGVDFRSPGEALVESPQARIRRIDGLREVWLDWLSPGETYRTEIEEARDLGDRVLLLVHDFGRRTGSTQEVALNGASVWTVRDGTIVRAEFHSDRTTALEAVGRGGRRCRRRTWKSLADLSQQSTPAKA
jgi:hypothetical protein